MDQIKEIEAKEISISVKRIKVSSFSINELAIKPEIELVKVELEQNLGFAIDKNLIEFKIRTFYHYANDPTILADITVQNVFEIPGLNRFYHGTFIVLPEQAIITIVGLSISHTRALLAQNLYGTALQESIMSIINPVEVAKHYFPYMFNPQISIEELGKQFGKE